jgi:hypothetical protein
MRRLMAIAACGLALVPPSQAMAWASTTTAHNLNTHGCLDRMAYAFLEKDPAFAGSHFPTLAAIEAHEGADIMQSGPGPDAKGSSAYSYHWYNPRTGEGFAPLGVAKNFLPLAYGQQGREKGAAWSAHFLADAHVPYHLNGEYVTDLRTQVASGAHRVILEETVTGDRAVFGRPTASLAAGLAPHSEDFTVEAERFLAVADVDDHMDWFDPWFWNGVTDTAPYLTSNHVLWEGQAPECPATVTQYSTYWTGNPQTQLGDPTAEINKALVVFVRRMAKDVADHAAARVSMPGVGEALAAESIATLWRASFSALRTNALVTYDPATLSDPNVTPVADLQGKLGNLARETAGQVQVRVRVVSGSCRLLTAKTPEVQTLASLPTSTINFGHWKVQVPRPGQCRLSVEAVGRYYNTPDLQLAWRNLYVTAPALTSPPPGECRCKPGDTLCLTLCHHDPGRPPGEL